MSQNKKVIRFMQGKNHEGHVLTYNIFSHEDQTFCVCPPAMGFQIDQSPYRISLPCTIALKCPGIFDKNSMKCSKLLLVFQYLPALDQELIL